MRIKPVCGLLCVLVMLVSAGCTTKKEAAEQQEQEAQTGEETSNNADPVETASDADVNATIEARARDSQRKADLATVKTALELYYQDNSFTYPDVVFYGELDEALYLYFELGNFPDDPTVEMNYRYAVLDGLNVYVLGTWLEAEAEYYVVDSALSDYDSTYTSEQRDQLIESIRGDSPFDYSFLVEDEDLPQDIQDAGSDNQKKADLANVKTALEIYYMDNSFTYPAVDSYEQLEDVLWFDYGSGDFPVGVDYYYEVSEGAYSYQLWTPLSDGSEYRLFSSQ